MKSELSCLTCAPYICSIVAVCYVHILWTAIFRCDRYLDVSLIVYNKFLPLFCPAMRGLPGVLLCTFKTLLGLSPIHHQSMCISVDVLLVNV